MSKQTQYKQNQFEIDTVKRWNQFTEYYCITIPTIARSIGYTNSIKLNNFLQGKCSLSSRTIGNIEKEMMRLEIEIMEKSNKKIQLK
jgi:hypothetical protein